MQVDASEKIIGAAGKNRRLKNETNYSLPQYAAFREESGTEAMAR